MFPTEIKAGLSFKASMVLPLYPFPDWTLTAYLRGAGSIEIVADPDTPYHVFLVGADVTTLWPEGNYGYSVRASKNSEVIEIQRGFLKILPDIALFEAGADPREHARKVLDAIEKLIEKRATKDQQRYTVTTENGSRELWRLTLEELLMFRNNYKQEVARLEAKGKGYSLFNQSLKVRFRNV